MPVNLYGLSYYLHGSLRNLQQLSKLFPICTSGPPLTNFNDRGVRQWFIFLIYTQKKSQLQNLPPTFCKLQRVTKKKCFQLPPPPHFESLACSPPRTRPPTFKVALWSLRFIHTVVHQMSFYILHRVLVMFAF